jgi:hypothetical protein
MKDINMERFGSILQSRDQLPSLNSATKYPSIPTYHVLGERGRLTENLSVMFPDEPVWLTEKVNGTNSRVIVFPNGSFIIGSRDELLYASGDFIRNQTLGIVETLLQRWTIIDGDRPVTGMVSWERFASPDALVVFFMEVYGRGVGKAAKNYAHNRDIVSFRLFDTVRIPLPTLSDLLDMKPEGVARWRDNSEHNGQIFDSFSELKATGLPVVPNVAVVSVDELPKNVQDASDFLGAKIGHTCCPLTVEYSGNAEGLVLRTDDRRVIAKMRFEDYARTLR